MSQPSILIVDDNPRVREALLCWLSAAFPECRLLVAQGGQEAVNSALAQVPEVVVMDITMPRMNGLEATQLIKAVLPQTRVVIFSIHAESVYQERALAAGADDFVAKEHDLGRLMTAIRRGLPTAPLIPDERIANPVQPDF
jgi:DNA-binding NarL/FixJ family response regulator